MRTDPTGTNILVPAMLVALVTLAACSGGDDPTQPAPTTGSLAVTVTGVPDGIEVDVRVAGPESFSAVVHDDTTFTGLVPGSYVLTASTAVDDLLEIRPDGAARSRTVEAGETATIDVVYTSVVARGHLAVQLDGLPPATDGAVLVTGPGGFQRALTTTDTLRSLQTGTYDVTATAVSDGSLAYVPTPTSADVAVEAGATMAAQVDYEPQEVGDLDFGVTGVEIVQAVQRPASDVPLVRSRDALVRVYVTATESSPVVPDVELEVRVNGDVVATPVIEASFTSVPTTTDRGDLSSSYNWTIPGTHVQPGLEIVATVDPQDEAIEADETNNRHPEDGSRKGFTVASIDPLPLTLVPIRQSVNGATGDVDAGNTETFVTTARAMYPFPDVDVTVRKVYTTDAPVLQSDNGNGAWSTVLQEVQLLRQTDAAETYYFGVVSTTYSSGVAGMGYIPSSRTSDFRTAIGWDRANSRAGVLAHELGHNLGRYHGPCGGAANADPDYPYGGGVVGQWGFDPRSGQLVDPVATHDIMTYCNPQWISDYHFEGILEFMDATLTRRATSERTCLLVWGRIRDGEVTLDPAAVLTARPNVPAAPGDHRVHAVDAEGNTLVDLSFDAPRVGCTEAPDESAFTWLIPIGDEAADRLHRVRVSGKGHEAVRTRHDDTGAPARRPVQRLERTGPRRAVLRWDATARPLAIVRDARDGSILAVGRQGELAFECSAAEVDVVFSDGVRSQVWSRALD